MQLFIIGLLFIVSGFFVMDPAGTPLDQASMHGIIHGLAGGIIFTLAFKAPALQASFTPWLGLIQRMIIIPFLLWLFLFAYRLFRLQRPK